ncbi:hypothetical protein VTN31DRAFT_6880 [Thermomyces dupontii]|uniref:uncharacterized protein n=1 Tax=Talaromyces thermophilus TaxID=28565 RepID=UPI003741FC3F
MSNVSSDLIWEISRSQNSYLVKNKMADRALFSRDPLNPLNFHSRKLAGFVNDKAVNVQPTPEGGVVLLSKTVSKGKSPASNIRKVTWGPRQPNRKIYKAIADATVQRGYRADLREATVARASAIRYSQRPKKETPPPKLRGAKARAAAEKA